MKNEVKYPIYKYLTVNKTQIKFVSLFFYKKCNQGLTIMSSIIYSENVKMNIL